MRLFFAHRPSPAMVVAFAALLVALGGTSYAIQALPQNSVGTKQLKNKAVTSKKIKNGAVNSNKVKNGSLLSADFQAGQLPAGPQGERGPTGERGPQGLEGPQGVPGAPATKLFAEISSGATPAVLYGQGVTGVTNAGTFYVVTFDRDISQCAPLGTTTGTSGNNVDSRINVVHRAGGPTQLNVRTYTGASENAVTNVPFSIAVLC